MATMTDDELRALWRSRGGKFYGPNVEHGDMPEHLLLPFLRELLELAPGTIKVEPTQITFGGGIKAYPSKVVRQAQRLADNIHAANQAKLPASE